MVDYSLNEVEATVKKAVRAVGYPWGLAEEAARSAGWLCHHGRDGCAAIARHLAFFDPIDIKAHSPCLGADSWQASEQALCPLLSGVTLSDRGQQLVDGTLVDSSSVDSSQGEHRQQLELQFNQVVEPLLLCFFAAQVARQTTTVVRLAWQDCYATTDGLHLSMSGTRQAAIADITLSLVDTRMTRNTLSQRGYPSEKTWEILNQYAARTYAPATDESRLKGAGAGLSDND